MIRLLTAKLYEKSSTFQVTIIAPAFAKTSVVANAIQGCTVTGEWSPIFFFILIPSFLLAVLLKKQ